MIPFWRQLNYTGKEVVAPMALHYITINRSISPSLKGCSYAELHGRIFWTLRVGRWCALWSGGAASPHSTRHRALTQAGAAPWQLQCFTARNHKWHRWWEDTYSKSAFCRGIWVVFWFWFFEVKVYRSGEHNKWKHMHLNHTDKWWD